MRRAMLVALTAIAVTSAAAAAWAHAHLQRALPASGSTLSAAPSEVHLWFTEAIEPSLSAIAVTDAAGKRVDKNDAGPGAEPKTLRIGLGALAAGSYQVRWHVVSVDTHRTEGKYAFTVRP